MSRRRFERANAACRCLVCASACASETRVSLFERPPIDAGHDSDVGSAGAPNPSSVASHLVHRYSFSGEGTGVRDSVGSADGTRENGALLDGAGHAALDGFDDYVNLPRD